MTTRTSLASLISQDQWNAFDEAWTEHMLEGGEVAPVLQALALAAERKKIPRCVGLAREHAVLLVGAGRPAQAAELLGSTMLWGGSPGELGEDLHKAALAAWSSETWWPAYSGLAGLRSGALDMREAWRRFEKLLALREGRAVHHAQGWGPGKVVALDRTALEVQIEFANQRSDRFPLASALDIFEVLEDDDLRALRVLDPARLERLLKEDHAEVLKAVLRRFRGKASHGAIKNALVQLGLSAGAFSGWWRRARMLAETSGWFDVTGTGTKAQIEMRYTESDPTAVMRRQLLGVQDLGALLTRVRSLLGGEGRALGADVRTVALEVLEQAASRNAERRPERLAAWMLLRDELGSTPAPLAELLASAARAAEPSDPSQPPELWAVLQQMPGAREQERALALLQEVYGSDAWIAEAARHLPHAPPGMVRALVDALRLAGREAELAHHYALLLARPLRNPHVLVVLAELAENDVIHGDLPGPIQRAQVLLSLAVQLEETRANNAPVQRTRARLTALLTEGEPSVLRRLLAQSDMLDLRSLVNLVERGIEGAIDHALTEIVVERAPEVYRAREKPFWETGGVWSTRRGLQKQQAEMRHLRDVKIPENSEAIGRAASFGDLSENSEWEAAIEEQRTLTSRLQQMELELRSARLLDDVMLPENTVAPGTSVRFLELPDGPERRVLLLGPWDGDDADVISYRSPLALGILGRHPGDEAKVELPGGAISVRILEVEPARLVPAGE